MEIARQFSFDKLLKRYVMKLMKLALGAAAALPLVFASQVSATSLKKLDFDDMVAQANACVVAEAQSATTEFRNGQVTTLTTFRVTKSAFGNVGQTITVATDGGERTMGRLQVAEVNAGAPRFFTNQESLLFLSEANAQGAFNILGYNQGRFAVRENANGVDMVSLPVGDGGQITLDNALSVISDARSNPNSSDIRR